MSISTEKEEYVNLFNMAGQLQTTSQKLSILMIALEFTESTKVFDILFKYFIENKDEYLKLINSLDIPNNIEDELRPLLKDLIGEKILDMCKINKLNDLLGEDVRDMLIRVILKCKTDEYDRTQSELKVIYKNIEELLLINN